MELKGLNGWLALLGIGVVVAPFQITNVLINKYLPLFSYGPWLGVQGVSDTIAMFVVFETLALSVFAVCHAYLIYLYFKKSRRFRSWFVWLLLAEITNLFLDFASAAIFGLPVMAGLLNGWVRPPQGFGSQRQRCRAPSH